MERPMKERYVVIDVAKCENCHNCFLACKDEHVGNDWPGCSAPMASQGPSWIRIEANERGQYPLIDVAYLPTPCQHCDDPACLKADRNHAVRKRPDGIVLLDPVKAKGQKHLVQACPYGAIVWNEAADLPQKCTLCAHLLDQGWQQTRCVQACPTGALTLRHGEPAEMAREAEAEGWETLRPQAGTRPRVYYQHLYRFTHCFIAGSVAIDEKGRSECAAGATVRLFAASGQEIATATADAYGDFKFDRLEPQSGSYTLLVSLPGHPEKRVAVDLKQSVNLGTLVL
jgi:Fe-S-cluster-containing dehydrogenase component